MKRSRLLPPLLLPVLFFFTACFPPGTTPVRFALQVTVEGEGQVYPNSGTFTKDLLLDFDIRPANGWEFSNWKGQNQYEVVQNDNRWYLKMNGDKSLIAVFERIDDGSQPGTYSLSVNTLGGGTVYPNSGRFPANQILKLDVRPENGWAFDRWEGPIRADVYGSNNNFSINMNGDKILIAIFQEDSCKLSISVTGKGKVEEKLLGAGYAKGSMVRLTAMADAGWEFKEWQGGAFGKDEIIYLEIERDTDITAIFIKKINKYTLTIDIQGKGNVEEKLISDQDY